MIALSTMILSALFLISGYLTSRSISAPNPDKEPSQRSTTKDSIRLFVDLTAFVFGGSTFMLLVTGYHALLAIIFFSGEGTAASPIKGLDSAKSICPNPSSLNPALFTFSPTTILCLAGIILVGAPLRLVAYGGLGKNFTFRLATPDHLVTTGIYRYIQHPSYSGIVVVALANSGLFFRWDGAWGCFVSETSSFRRVTEAGIGLWVVLAVTVFALVLIRLRLRDEEEMLKKKFGKEWEEWNAKTARFIPYLI